MIEPLISPVVPVLHPSDTGEHALSLMQQNNFTELPLVDDEEYIALIKENDLLDWESPNEPLSSADFLNYKPAAPGTAHPFDIIKLAFLQDIGVIPVIDNSNNYLGSVTRDTLFNYIANHSGFLLTGGIIVLEVNAGNYSLYEIARICENEDVMITNVQVAASAQASLLEVTLKTNRTSLQGVVSALERYKYTVKEVYGEVENADDTMGRYNLLMNYLNM